MHSKDQSDVLAERVISEDLDFPPSDLEPRLMDMSGITMWMLGHAHIDLGYRWDLNETIHRITPWTFRGVLDMIREHPGFVFAQSQMYLYHAMEQAYPGIFAEVLTAIRAGQWDVVGGSWCEYDTSLCSGEAVIRQHLQGLQYARDRLGAADIKVAFVPDSFIGHPRTLPQILSGCGMEFYLFGRGLPQDPEHPERTRRAFKWVGPDGSQLIAYLPFGPYSNPPMTQSHLMKLSRYTGASVSDQELVLFGSGDHGGGPRAPDFAALESLADDPHSPRWKFGTLEDFFATTFRDPMVSKLASHRHSLRAFATGALTSQAQVKRLNRRLERRLQESESMSTIATVLQRKPSFPRVDFQHLWRDLLMLQFHDILPGTSCPSVYRDARRVYQRIDRSLGRLDRDSIDRIASRIDTTGLEGFPFVVMNASTRRHFACAQITVPPHVLRNIEGPCEVRDAMGRHVSAFLRGDRILLPVELPGLGYRTYSLVPAAEEWRRDNRERKLDGVPGAGWYTFDGHELRTPRYTVVFSAETGSIDRITDRSTGTVVLDGPSNDLELWTEYEMATSWVEALHERRRDVIPEGQPEVVAANPYFVTVMTRAKTACSEFVRRTTLYREESRVDFRLTMDWRESNSFLKLSFSPPFDGAVVRTSLPYGFEEVDDPGKEFLMHDWVDIEAQGRGITLVNDGSYAADVSSGRLRLSTIRNVRDMDPAMSFGRHELRYTAQFRSKPFSEIEVQRTVGDLTARLHVGWTGHHPGGLKTWGMIDSSQPIAPHGSFIDVRCTAAGGEQADEAAVQIVAFKMPEGAYTPEGFVIRVRELTGGSQAFTVRLPVKVDRVALTDHLERPLDEGRTKPGSGTISLEPDGSAVSGRIRGYAIMTFIAYL